MPNEGKKPTYVTYEHHGTNVKVREDLKGTHRSCCMCFDCGLFRPGHPANCPIAQALYELDIQFKLVTPVFECPEFSEGKADLKAMPK